jgi:NAD(P)-dependent dehydrogenase (short-subunit alcohol dehydrogenase family)
MSAMSDQQARVAIVTGGGDGIGRAVVRRLARDGATVLVSDISATSGQAAVDEVIGSGGAAAFVRADVSDKDEIVGVVQHALDRWGHIDILVNNAWGGGTLSRVERKTDADLAHGFGVGFYGPFWAMQAAFDSMKARGWGRIVNLCSLNGVNAHMGTLEYNAAKEALRALTRTAAREWAPHGICVNAVCPGAKSAAFRRIMAEHPELEAAADGSNPMGRIGDPDADIAPVIAFLASDDCRYLTGNTLFVDGGGHINGVVWAPDLDAG